MISSGPTVPTSNQDAPTAVNTTCRRATDAAPVPTGPTALKTASRDAAAVHRRCSTTAQTTKTGTTPICGPVGRATGAAAGSGPFLRSSAFFCRACGVSFRCARVTGAASPSGVAALVTGLQWGVQFCSRCRPPLHLTV